MENLWSTKEKQVSTQPSLTLWSPLLVLEMSPEKGWGLGALSLEMWLWATPRPSMGLGVLIYEWGC